MIAFDNEQRVFHLSNGKLSMVLTLRSDAGYGEELLLSHFGAPVGDPAACAPAVENHASVDAERSTLPYACPADGRGDYRPSMLRARDAR